MTKDDYVQWRDSTVSQEFIVAVIHQMDNHIADLITMAGDDPLRDKWRRGMIEGLRFLTEWEPEFEENREEGEDEDGDSSSGASAPY
jgi:hypothetical protein